MSSALLVGTRSPAPRSSRSKGQQTRKRGDRAALAKTEIKKMKTLFALATATFLVASPVFAGPYAGLAGDTPNTGPEGTGNFVRGRPEGRGNFVSGTPGNPENAMSGPSLTTPSKSGTNTESSQ